MKTIRMEQIRAVISPMISTTLFSNKPDEIDTPSGTFVYLSLITDNVSQASMQNYVIKEARVSFTIVCKTTLGVLETEESVLMDVVDEIDLMIGRQACNKINVIDIFSIQEIQSSTLSPIFYNQKNRPYIVKDFIFKYEQDV